MKNIYFIIEHLTHYFFLKSVIDNIKHNVFFIVENAKIEKMLLGDGIDKRLIVIGYNKKTFVQENDPDLVVTCKIWKKEIADILKAWREKNIPIFMYDHGALNFTCEFLHDGSENKTHYRSDIACCSHVLCWGEYGKKCWLSYALDTDGLKDKFHVVGAPQYDVLFKKKENRKDVLSKLGIKTDKKIILFLSALHHPHQESNDRNFMMAGKLKKFVLKNNDYQLVVKPHPVEMERFEKSPFSYSKNTIFVSNEYESRWNHSVVIDIYDLISHSDVVVSTQSSLLIAPLMMNIPVIHIDVDIPSVSSFSKFVNEALLNLKNETQLEDFIINSKKYYDKKRKGEAKKIAGLMNRGVDGNATQYFLALIDKVLEDVGTKNFYKLSIEEEYLLGIKKFPDMPYQYKNLIEYYCELKNFNLAKKYFDVYVSKFKQYDKLFEIISVSFLNENHFPEEIVKFFDDYSVVLAKWPLLAIRVSAAYRNVKDYKSAVYLLSLILIDKCDLNLKCNFFYEMGLCCLMDNKVDDSLKNFSKCLETGVVNEVLGGRFFFRKAQALIKKGKKVQAIDSLETCLELSPDHVAAKKILNKI